MNFKTSPYLTLAAIATTLAGCASVPPSNAALDAARSAYQQAAADPAVMQSAPVEIRRAQEALGKATDAQKSGADKVEVDHDA